MDVENLDEGQDFKELPDTYTIFITEKDFFGKGEPVYLIQNMNCTTGQPFLDGAYIIYVNGEYRGDDEIGLLMHDFNCTDAKDMHYDLMAERTRYLKENPEGVDIMCKSMEDMRDRARAEGADKKAMDMARGLHEQGVDVSIIANAAGVAVEIVMKWLGIQPA